MEKAEVQAGLQAVSIAEIVLLNEIPQGQDVQKEKRTPGAVPLHRASWHGSAETKK